MSVLLSIRPKYAEAIMKGGKKYEFRKSGFRKKDQMDIAYVYSSLPVGKIVCAFKIDKIIEDTPARLWERFGTKGGIDEEEFFAYYGSGKVGVAMKIGELRSFIDPVEPRTLISNFRPPQSFAYMSSDTLRSLGLSDLKTVEAVRNPEKYFLLPKTRVMTTIIRRITRAHRFVNQLLNGESKKKVLPKLMRNLS